MAARATIIRNKMVSRLMICVFIVFVFTVCLKFIVKSILNYTLRQPTLSHSTEPLLVSGVLLSEWRDQGLV